MSVEVIYQKDGETRFGTYQSVDIIDRLLLVEELEAKGFQVLYAEYE